MIQNIIFDFGGVIYDIDHEKTKKAFANLGVKNFESLYGHAIQTRLFEDLEIGKTSPSTFREAIRKHLPKNTLDQEIDLAWNALLIGFKPTRLELLERVGKQYRIFLLSNTNQIHYQQYMGELRKLNSYEKFTSVFEKLYFSHQIGMRKPDPKIFNYVLQENHIQASETVFIDDYDLNVSTANKLGLQGLLLQHDQDVIDLFTTEGRLKN
jgi:putative hydrolase of the HAD superfamily